MLDTMHEEKRSEERFDRKLAIVGTVRRCPEDPSMEGCPIVCETVNISGHGIQFRSDMELPQDTRVRVAIAYTPKEIYSVEGEVRWCRLEDEIPTLGIELVKDEDSDLVKWLELLQTSID